ncbi:MAG: hypothetical protein KGH95_07905 [Thaumarchaeota archaeon]|nr:hypothetical protein [Nitrososphaerota archaeon]
MKNFIPFLLVSSLVICSTAPSFSQDYSIPSWIKKNAKFWSEGTIQDNDFTKGIEYLVQTGVIKVQSTPTMKISSKHIPKWIKNNAGQWVNGTINDSDFVKGIEYLVQTGIIQTNSTQKSEQNSQTETSDIIPTTCTAQEDGILPDPNCTPGAIDPRVTQDNIDSTICVPGYTKTVRPPVSYTEPLKLKMMDAYGFTDSPKNYEFDHLIPLEVGGNPTDIKNLWPEPHDTTPDSFDKDKFENYLHEQVCSGAMDLATAQNQIATNWEKYWEDAGRP